MNLPLLNLFQMHFRATIVLFVAIFLFSFQTLATDSLSLDIKVEKISNEKIYCNFLYHCKIERNANTDIFLVALPFSQNQKLEYSILTNDANLVVSYGFNSIGKGVLCINAFKKPIDFDVEFSNVELTPKPTPGDENGLIVTLDFGGDFLGLISEQIRCLSLSEVRISNTNLTNSNPKFVLIEKHSYLLSSLKMLENIYFVVPKPTDSYLSTFMAFMTISIFIGIFSSIKLLVGKTESILGGVIGLLLLAFLGYLVFSKIVPEDFTKDIDMISIIGGGIGLCIGVVLNSAYNLITINAIERQQAGRP